MEIGEETLLKEDSSERKSLDEERDYLFSHDEIILRGRKVGYNTPLPEWEGVYYFDEEAADDICLFAENFIYHIEGELRGLALTLEPWERDSLREIFGWKKCSDGTRKYQRVYFFLPRKNGKSFIASIVGLFLLLCDGEGGPQIYSAAADKEQAGIVFNTAKSMVEMSQDLLDMCDCYKRSIVNLDNGGSYKVLSADAPNKHGKNSHGVLFDELHVQKTRELWDTLTTSISARRQPLILAMTTAGFDKTTICWEIHDYAVGVRDGIVFDEEFLPLLFCADEEDDWTAEETWYKANPNLGISKTIAYMRKECDRAKNSPSYENTFRRLELNQWTEQETRFIQMKEWEKCSAPVDEERLKGKPTWGGLDLASTRDTASLALLFRGDEIEIPLDPVLIEGMNEEEIEEFFKSIGADENGLRKGFVYDVIWRIWCPEETVKMRSRGLVTNLEKATSRAMRAKYDKWVKEGLIIPTPGNVIDYDRIRKEINALQEIYDIQEIAIDRWNAQQLSTQLEGDGIVVAPAGQGYATMSDPTKRLDTLILSQRIRHGGHAVAKWMAKNLATQKDAAGNIKPNKEKSADKIDGMVALIMAIWRESISEDVGSVYDERGLVVLE